MADINRLELLLVIRSKVVGSMSVAVICAALYSSIFEYACRY